MRVPILHRESDRAESAESLKAVLTPALFRRMVNARIPFDRHKPLDFSEVGRLMFSDGSFTANIRGAFPVLQKLSKIGLDDMPDLTQFLPEPADDEFPELCLGLVVLIDQAPRALCQGVDGRWVNGYFDVLSQRLRRHWHGLPAGLRPDLFHRWTIATGTSFDFWLLARYWFLAPIVHSESVHLHQLALSINEDTRRLVELSTGTTDPYRLQRDEILADIYGFPRVVSEGPPEGHEVTIAEWSFWWAMLMDVHNPIIDQFGRYPYRNAVLGRESTPEEKEWLDATDHFAEIDPEAAKHIRDDVCAGRWTPLGEANRE